MVEKNSLLSIVCFAFWSRSNEVGIGNRPYREEQEILYLPSEITYWVFTHQLQAVILLKSFLESLCYAETLVESKNNLDMAIDIRSNAKFILLTLIHFKLYNKLSYARILIGSQLWSIGRQTYRWRHH